MVRRFEALQAFPCADSFAEKGFAVRWYLTIVMLDHHDWKKYLTLTSIWPSWRGVLPTMSVLLLLLLLLNIYLIEWSVLHFFDLLACHLCGCLVLCLWMLLDGFCCLSKSLFRTRLSWCLSWICKIALYRSKLAKIREGKVWIPWIFLGNQQQRTNERAVSPDFSYFLRYTCTYGLALSII